MSAEFQQLAREAERHLAATDPRLAALIETHGPCTFTPDPDLFRCAVKSIVSQMISTAGANTIFARLEALLGGKVVPKNFGRVSDEELRGCGLSGGKVKAMRGLVEQFQSPKMVKQLLALDDDTLRKTMVSWHGIGPWTVDMLMIFSLGRPDIWPIGDLVIRQAAKEVFRLRGEPTAQRLTSLANPWRPYRTIATWYLWRSRG